MANYNCENWQKSMKLRFDYNNMMAKYVGKNEGLQENELEKMNGFASRLGIDTSESRTCFLGAFPDGVAVLAWGDYGVSRYLTPVASSVVGATISAFFFFRCDSRA